MPDEPALLVPVIVVASRGGPYHDDSFEAGYHYAAARLALDVPTREAYQATVPTPLVPQLDLLAMEKDFRLIVGRLANPGWSVATFLRNRQGFTMAP